MTLRGWRILAENHWRTFGENAWRSVGENTWRTLGDNPWRIIARKLTLERARYACPLRYPIPSGQTCPIQHKNWAKDGCFSTIATSPGARLRYQMDRDSETYKTVYRQRTATERINSQAVSLGIERPRLRNGASIANHNTLTYVLINLHALQRVRQRKATRTEPIRKSVQAK